MTVLDRIDRKINNMNAMLLRIGIDPDALRRRRPECFRRSMHACQACPNGDICGRWLVHAPKRIDRVPEFCPNGQRFEQTKAMMKP